MQELPAELAYRIEDIIEKKYKEEFEKACSSVLPRHVILHYMNRLSRNPHLLNVDPILLMFSETLATIEMANNSEEVFNRLSKEKPEYLDKIVQLAKDYVETNVKMFSKNIKLSQDLLDKLKDKKNEEITYEEMHNLSSSFLTFIAISLASQVDTRDIAYKTVFNEHSKEIEEEIGISLCEENNAENTNDDEEGDSGFSPVNIDLFGKL